MILKSYVRHISRTYKLGQREGFHVFHHVPNTSLYKQDKMRKVSVMLHTGQNEESVSNVTHIQDKMRRVLVMFRHKQDKMRSVLVMLHTYRTK